MFLPGSVAITPSKAPLTLDSLRRVMAVGSGCSALFFVVGDNGDVLHWRFTRGESFNEVSDIFKDLNQRYQSLGRNVEGIVIDNCCK